MTEVFFMSSKSKNENKNIKALFSVLCLCIIALGLIVYFSTNTNSENNAVNEATTINETTTQVNRAVTVTETKPATTVQTTAGKTTTKKKEETTMQQGKNNTPYKSFYKYPLTEAVERGYTEELVYDKTMGDYRAHTAVDFAGSAGDEVVAINDGLVLNVYTDNMYGNVVEVDHGGKLVVKYCGLDSVAVKKGSYINIGNKIGTLGKVAVEAGEGEHLHLEAKLDGKTVNPLDVMGKID